MRINEENRQTHTHTLYLVKEMKEFIVSYVCNSARKKTKMIRNEKFTLTSHAYMPKHRYIFGKNDKTIDRRYNVNWEHSFFRVGYLFCL